MNDIKWMKSRNEASDSVSESSDTALRKCEDTLKKLAAAKEETETKRKTILEQKMFKSQKPLDEKLKELVGDLTPAQLKNVKAWEELAIRNLGDMHCPPNSN